MLITATEAKRLTQEALNKHSTKFNNPSAAISQEVEKKLPKFRIEVNEKINYEANSGNTYAIFGCPFDDVVMREVFKHIVDELDKKFTTIIFDDVTFKSAYLKISW